MKSRSPTICPMVYSLDLFGDRWTLVVLRDVLIFDKTHFRQFLASKENIAKNILTDRLHLLVDNGFLVKEQDPANKSAAVYRPTQKTLDLLPMMLEMMKWGAAYNPHTDRDSGPVMRQLLGDPHVLQEKIASKFELILGDKDNNPVDA